MSSPSASSPPAASVPVPYACWRSRRSGPHAEETPPAAPPRPRPERSTPEWVWQGRWFAGDFGREFVSTQGERLRVVQFGSWNRESGPDFQDAVICFPDRAGAPARRGAVELDRCAEDWERHGHGANPAFDAVVLHVFLGRRDPGRVFFTRTSRHAQVAQVHLDPEARAGVTGEGAEADGGDPGPAPLLPASEVLAKPGRCAAPLRGLTDERVHAVLTAAARYRLAAKGARWRRLVALRGPDEALYQVLAAALGYKSNDLPFAVLAQRLPLAGLRPARGPRAQARERAAARLFGVAGFLRVPPRGGFAADPAARDGQRYFRRLWEQWWREAAGWERLVLPAGAWRLGGVRPANHPHRRLGALAQIVWRWPRVRALLDHPDPIQEVPRVLGGLREPFWNFHCTLASARLPRPLALVGPARAVYLLANVFLPAAVAATAARPALWEGYEKLRAPLANRRVETAATRLFGSCVSTDERRRRRRVLGRAVYQQGLLQIFEDFCRQDLSDCARCPLPERLAEAARDEALGSTPRPAGRLAWADDF